MPDPTRIRPMLASVDAAPLDDPRFAYEPKYDGIRALIQVDPGRPLARVSIASRLGNDKTAQFPEIVRALGEYGRALKAGVLLDGEIVALDEEGDPAGFQKLQGRIHLSRAAGIRRPPGAAPVAFIAFDILFDGAEDLRDLPLTTRRARLERVFGNTGSSLLRLSEFVPADGRALYREALSRGWEGLVAKHLDSRYKSGKRTPDWRKLKITLEQEFVVGGWTEPRHSRGYLGALLLGVHENGGLHYVGHTGTGFSEAELHRVWELLREREIAASPFRNVPRPNERPHWAKPELVAQVRFTEWTDDRKLRHPIYLGLRDDVMAAEVRREPVAGSARDLRRAARSAGSVKAAGRRTGTSASQPAPRPVNRGGRRSLLLPVPVSRTLAPLVDRLAEIESGGGDGTVTLPDGGQLKVGNLDKVFWPARGFTKGDLMRYYAAVSPALLPNVADRPLVMKRLPNGVRGKAFYQQRAPDDVPPGVRVATLPGDSEVPSRLVGGTLTCLLYMTQLAAVSQDPWFSRVASPQSPDHVALDLDPMPGITFAEVLDVARWAHDELEALGVPGYPKTSGADGLHVYIPLPAGTPYDTAVVFCQLLATLVAQKHPALATVTRSVHARGRKVYVDYLQNVRGKTLATAYSARASEYAGVSAPLSWKEVHAGVEREAFDLESMPARLRESGDLWAGIRKGKPADLRAVVEGRIRRRR
jgi:bifunctional non-homologous end joining protein LigD